MNVTDDKQQSPHDDDLDLDLDACRACNCRLCHDQRVAIMHALEDAAQVLRRLAQDLA